MSEADSNARLIREFHDAQNLFYAGGDQEQVRTMLAEDVAWHVPGRSAIAGDYRGLSEVLRYFVTRRELAQATFRIAVRGVLADAERAVIFAEGHVQLGNESATWETVAVFRITSGLIAECWVLPYDQYSFDEIWAASDDRPA